MAVRRSALAGGVCWLSLAAASLTAAPVSAQCVDVEGQYSCSPDGNPYPDGIRADVTGDLTAILLPGLVVETVAPQTGGVMLSATGSLSLSAGAEGSITTFNEPIDPETPVSAEAIGAPGISATGGTDTSITVSNVTTRGANSPAILVSAGGAVTLSASELVTSGEFSNAVDITAGGAVDLDVRNVLVEGAGSSGVVVDADGPITGFITGLTQNGPVQQVPIVDAPGSGEPTEGEPATTPVGGNAVNLTSRGNDITLSLGDLNQNVDTTAVTALSRGGGVVVNVDGAVATLGPALDLTATASELLDTDNNPRTDPVRVLIPGAGSPARQGVVTVNIAARAPDAPEEEDGPRIESIVGPAIRINAETGSTINNANIINRISFGADRVMEITGGATTINNDGTIVGTVRLTGNADTFNNRGTYSFLGGADFDNYETVDRPGVGNSNAGIDIFNNSGTVILTDSYFGPKDANLVNMEVFNNSGLIDMRSGVAGDVLRMNTTVTPNLPAGSLIPQSRYNGLANATLGIDIQFTETNALVDRLELQNVTGQTKVLVNVLGTAPANLLVAQPVVFLVDGSTGTFELAEPLVVEDIRYSLVYRPELNRFALYGAVPDGLIRLTKLPGNAQSLWYRTNDILSSHLRDERDRRWTDAEPKSRLWFQLAGDSTTRTERFDATINYVDTQGLNLSQRQRSVLGQMGYETAGPENGATGVVLGATAGYGTMNAKFRAASDEFKIDQLNVGAYVSWLVGRFYVTAAANYAKHAATLTEVSARVSNPRPSARSVGGAVELGARIGSDTFFVEPSAGFTYVVTRMNEVTLTRGAFAFDDFTGNLGSAGLRIGGRTAWGNRDVVYYAGGKVLREFAGNDFADVAIGGPTVDIPIRPQGTYGKFSAGVSIVSDRRANLFAEANGYIGSSYRGGGGRVGVRIGF